jgi:hypothetical protein
VVVDLKSTAVMASALVVVILYRRGGLRTAAIAAAVGVATALAPFALPNISAIKYIELLRATRSEGVEPGTLSASLLYALFLVLPLIVLKGAGVDPFPRKAGKPDVFTMLLFACCALALAFVASKPGAGPWHFWQLAPVLAMYLAMALGQAQAARPFRVDVAVLVIAFGSAAVTAAYARRDIAALLARPLEKADIRVGAREIDEYLGFYRGHIVQMGYGELPDETVSTMRYIPVLRGQPYTLDGSGRLEGYLQSFPMGIVEKMNNCTDDVWLIPHAQRPFVSDLFPDALRSAFAQRYTIQQQKQLLDAWVCKGK